MNVKGTKKKNQAVTANIFEQQELLKKAEVIRESCFAKIRWLPLKLLCIWSLVFELTVKAENKFLK